MSHMVLSPPLLGDDDKEDVKRGGENELDPKEQGKFTGQRRKSILSKGNSYYKDLKAQKSNMFVREL